MYGACSEKCLALAVRITELAGSVGALPNFPIQAEADSGCDTRQLLSLAQNGSFSNSAERADKHTRDAQVAREHRLLHRSDGFTAW